MKDRWREAGPQTGRSIACPDIVNISSYAGEKLDGNTSISNAGAVLRVSRRCSTRTRDS